MLYLQEFRKRIGTNSPQTQAIEIQRIQVATVIVDIQGTDSEAVNSNEHTVVNIAGSRPELTSDNGDVIMLEQFYQFLKYNQNNIKSKWLAQLTCRAQKIFWIFITLLAILDACIVIKLPLLEIKGKHANEIESTYIKTLQFMLQLILRCKFLHMLVFESNAWKDLLELVKESRSTSTHSVATLNPKNGHLPSALFVSSVILSIVYTFFGFDEIFINRYWNLSDLAIIHYQDVYSSFFEWGSAANITYSEEWTPSVGFFSALGFLTDFGSTFMEYFLRDIFIMLALTLKHEVDKVDTFRKQFESEHDLNKKQMLGMEIMMNYQSLLKVSAKINESFGTIITFLHAINVFLCVSFSDGLINTPDVGGGLLQITAIIKCVIAYSICLSTTDKVQKLRAWYRDEQTRIILDTDTRFSRFYAVMDEMDKNPIGIGNGEHYVNWQFVKKLMGLMMTYYLIIAKSSTP